MAFGRNGTQAATPDFARTGGSHPGKDVFGSANPVAVQAEDNYRVFGDPFAFDLQVL